MVYTKEDPRYLQYKRAEYQRNKKTYRDWHKRRTETRQEFIAKVKSNPCADCKQKFPPVCMDFDHLPGHEKLATVSFLFRRNAGLAEIAEEIAKCELVCSNCHRIRTEKRRRERCNQKK